MKSFVLALVIAMCGCAVEVSGPETGTAAQQSAVPTPGVCGGARCDGFTDYQEADFWCQINCIGYDGNEGWCYHQSDAYHGYCVSGFPWLRAEQESRLAASSLEGEVP